MPALAPAMEHPPILPVHRTPPNFGAMTLDECRAYCRRVWRHYVGPGVVAIAHRSDALDVLDILRAHTPPEHGLAVVG